MNQSRVDIRLHIVIIRIKVIVRDHVDEGIQDHNQARNGVLNIGDIDRNNSIGVLKTFKSKETEPWMDLLALDNRKTRFIDIRYYQNKWRPSIGRSRRWHCRQGRHPTCQY